MKQIHINRQDLINDLRQENEHLKEIIACHNENMGIKSDECEDLRKRLVKSNDWAFRMQEENEKAREIIKEWLRWANDDVESSEFQEIVNKSEQFLNREVKE